MPSTSRVTAKPRQTATRAARAKPALPHVPAVFVTFPFYNEMGALRGVVEELQEILPDISSRHQTLVVDDGSTDDTPDLVAQLAAEFPTLAGLELVRRTGKSTAVQAGLDRIPDWQKSSF